MQYTTQSPYNLLATMALQLCCCLC